MLYFVGPDSRTEARIYLFTVSQDNSPKKKRGVLVAPNRDVALKLLELRFPRIMDNIVLYEATPAAPAVLYNHECQEESNARSEQREESYPG